MMPALILALSAAAQTSEAASAVSAAELQRVMTARGLDAVAAEDDAEPGRFIAALAIPGQLLVVTARCEAVGYLRDQLARREYRDLYATLHGCALAPTKLFVHDMGADGLRSSPPRDAAPDIVYEEASRQILLDGNGRQQQLPKDAYAALCQKLDLQYDRMLTSLVRQLEP